MVIAYLMFLLMFWLSSVCMRAKPTFPSFGFKYVQQAKPQAQSARQAEGHDEERYCYCGSQHVFLFDFIKFAFFRFGS